MTTQIRTLIYQSHIVRRDLRGHPDRLYVFGDNLARTGLGGQAREMRSEPNAVGIPTKKSPSMVASAFLSDGDWDNWIGIVRRDVGRLLAHKGTIVWPANGIGTGLAELTRRSPKIYGAILMLERVLLEL